VTIEVQIATVFRAQADGRSKVKVDGERVIEVLDALFSLHPDLRTKVLTEDGRVRRFVNLYLDKEDIRALEGLESSVSNHTSLSIIPALAGG